MDSSMNEGCKSDLVGDPKTPEISKMSPITNLAFNLSGLTTSVAGTPIRRISWSNPIPGGDKIGLNLEDLSPSNTYSPTFQDELKGVKPKVVCLPSRYPIDSDNDNKENVTPKLKRISVLHGASEPLSIGCKKLYSKDRRDSGYSSLSAVSKVSVESFECSSSLIQQKGSVTYDEENSMDNIFDLEEADEHELFFAPDGLCNLLTKPLQSSSKSPKPLTSGLRRGKLPIRRCLSMEVEFNPDTPTTSKAISKNGTYLSSSISYGDSDGDLNENSNFKRPDPPSDLLGLQSKRRRSSPSIAFNKSPRSECRLQRSYSETAATIMHAILKSDNQPELIGDGSRMCMLPLVKGRHHDLKSITPDTLAQLLKGEMTTDSFTVVDCRYPYEFEGGHIQGAKNIFTKDAIVEKFFSNSLCLPRKNIIIFHCEFSSERAPTLCRFLRNKDRELNEGNYPHLYYPEMYILEGGYKAFFNSFKELCEPQTYKPMKHKDHGFELRHFRAKSKSWGADSKGRCQLRSNSKTSLV